MHIYIYLENKCGNILYTSFELFFFRLNLHFRTSVLFVFFKTNDTTRADIERKIKQTHTETEIFKRNKCVLLWFFSFLTLDM